MNIAKTYYSIQTKSFDIFVSGCRGLHCEDCYNPELWSFDSGDKYSHDVNKSILDYISGNDLMIDNIFIMGGEPLDQGVYQLRHLIRTLKLETNKKIWLFTRYELKEVPSNIKFYCDYIKTGYYDKNKLTDNNITYGVKLASNNQRIYKKGLDFL